MAAHVLVIEDNKANLDLMVYLLKAFGYEPLVAMNGEQGVQVALEALPDIICDLQLPGIDGFEVLRQLKGNQRMARTLIVAVTALAMVGDREKALAAGFDGYLSKPINPKTFVQQIEELLPSSVRPTTPKPFIHEPAAARAPAPAVLARVLVVDDSPVNRELLLKTLEPFGYQVDTARSVAEALECIKQQAPELIVSDFHMPKEGGLEFLAALKRDPALRRIPFLLMSSSMLGDIDERLALESGADKFIGRPVEPGLLLREIEIMLQTHGARGHGHDSGR
jgi:two-component system cell cycle response regulator